MKSIQNEIDELQRCLAARTEEQKAAKGVVFGDLCINITFLVARLGALRYQKQLLTPIGVTA